MVNGSGRCSLVFVFWVCFHWFVHGRRERGDSQGDEGFGKNAKERSGGGREVVNCYLILVFLVCFHKIIHGRGR